MTRCISTVLSKHCIAHVVHQGRVTIEGLGHIPVHFWIELQSKELVDLRARMWLGRIPEVPHGVFLLKPGTVYQSIQEIDPRRFSLSESIFHALSGIPLDTFNVIS